MKNDAHEEKNACSPGPSESIDVANLADKYKFIFQPQSTIKIHPTESVDMTRSTVDTMVFQNEDISIHNLVPKVDVQYEFPPQSGVPVIETIPQNFPIQGQIERITFLPDQLSAFEVTSQHQTLILNGTAHILDGDVTTDNLSIRHTNTEYFVEVTKGKETISILKGSVSVLEKGGAKRQTQLKTNETVNYSVGQGFSTVKTIDVAQKFSRFDTNQISPPQKKIKNGAETRTKNNVSDKNGSWTRYVLGLSVVILLAIGSVILVLRRKKASAQS
jgi:hypothetical protein